MILQIHRLLRISTAMSIVLGMVTFAPAEESDDEAAPSEKRKTSTSTEEVAGIGVVSSVNSTAVKLFGEIAKEDMAANVLLSPHSIGQAMLMVKYGAVGETLAEIDNALEFGSVPEEQILAEMSALKTALESTISETATFTSANALALIGKSSAVLPEYEALLRKSFGAAVFPDAQPDQVNSWVSEQTNGKIPELVKELGGRLLLLNALYFKADWSEPFMEKYTKSADFTKADGKKVSVPMMADTRSAAYFEEEGFTALALPYDGKNHVWVAVLPNEGQNDKLLEDGLSEEEWAGLIKRSESGGNRKVHVRMPKFDLEGAMSLNEPFKNIGMKRAFSDEAEFDRMSEDPMKVSDIQHVVKLTVNESGSEAAAVTAVGVFSTRGMPSPPKQFTLDRPFLFAIAEVNTGTMVVLGRVSDLPEE